jgi:hypothetical protein
MERHAGTGPQPSRTDESALDGPLPGAARGRGAAAPVPAVPHNDKPAAVFRKPAAD